MISNKYLINEVLEDFARNGIRELREFLENELMASEREEAVGAPPPMREPSIDKGYCNGFKDKKLLTRTGELRLKVPQLRGVDFHPSCLEKKRGLSKQ